MKKILFFVSILISGIHFSQTYYSQDFNTPGLNGWTSTDLDGDGYEWNNKNASSINPILGNGSLVSDSYVSGMALHPDNLITSPMIDLGSVAAGPVVLQFDQATEINYYAEKYSVYVTTSNTAGAITASVPVYTETVASGELQQRTIDITPYIGQQIYISFRHYDCTDEYYLILDNIKVRSIANKDVSVEKISLVEYGITNTNYQIKAMVKNEGSEPVNNVTLNWFDGTSNHTSTVSLPTPLTSGQKTALIHPVSVNYASVTEKNIVLTATQVNGNPDANPSDNIQSTTFRTVSQNSVKKVLIEEGTGTWCGYCPRGAVAMKHMDINFPNDFIGIAVHNGDPMMLPAYNSGAAFSGFPSMNVDRAALDESVSVNNMGTQVNIRKTIISPAELNASAILTGNALTFNASATFRTVITNADLRLAVVLVEDDVKGTTNGYNQVNYYAGNAGGAMGGYEALPNPVPASQMTYDHVGRMLLGGYEGEPGSVPASVTDGQVVSHTFTASIPAAYNPAKMKAVLLLLNGATGEVLNARSFIFSTLGTTTSETNKKYLTVYPNPAAEYFKVQSQTPVDIKVHDLSGKLVLQKENVSPDSAVSVENLNKGVYLVSIREKGAEPKVQKLIIK